MIELIPVLFVCVSDTSSINHDQMEIYCYENDIRIRYIYTFESLYEFHI